MKLNLGHTLKALRREKEITQEDLAEILGVSCQSVSRWELGVCYPDLELIPVIASYFGVSVDKLIGTDAETEKKRVDEYVTRFQTAISEGRVYDCIRIAREGVAEFPSSYVLLNKLMYALFVSGDETGNIPEWRENMRKYDAEIVAIGERIMKHCPDSELRAEATARLAFHHCEMGRRAQGRAIYETMPTSHYARDYEMWWALEEHEKLPYARAQAKSGYTNLCTGIMLITHNRLLPDADCRRLFDLYFAWDNMLYDKTGNPPDEKANDHYTYARICARLGDEEAALTHLARACEAAIAFDHRGESGKTVSLLFGEEAWTRTDYDTADSRPLCRILRDSWMANGDFDGLRNTEAFRSLLETLS